MDPRALIFLQILFHMRNRLVYQST